MVIEKYGPQVGQTHQRPTIGRITRNFFCKSGCHC
ncbi:hypothetical protein CCACVL1_05530 [Corchorus capsularis]|uniref:Uncharacterized protein n=1 Tax=Corchorus capsularis TaxID=210143 RepID=A0A1R3JK02_COCAP|nr:hypothetical protein CCACVL1_05530 [Corchorus capsularis]